MRRECLAPSKCPADVGAACGSLLGTGQGSDPQALGSRQTVKLRLVAGMEMQRENKRLCCVD